MQRRSLKNFEIALKVAILEAFTWAFLFHGFGWIKESPGLVHGTNRPFSLASARTHALRFCLPVHAVSVMGRRKETSAALVKQADVSCVGTSPTCSFFFFFYHSPCSCVGLQSSMGKVKEFQTWGAPFPCSAFWCTASVIQLRELFFPLGKLVF